MALKEYSTLLELCSTINWLKTILKQMKFQYIVQLNSFCYQYFLLLLKRYIKIFVSFNL